jgi:hypothetical protein
MGLEMYVGDDCVWSSRYSTFNDWRDYLYAISGYPDVESFPIMRRNGYGYWKDIPSDPMVILMLHHDDAGYIFPKEARLLRDRIKLLKPEVCKEWVRHTNMFLKALSTAIKRDERIEFH